MQASTHSNGSRAVTRAPSSQRKRDGNGGLTPRIRAAIDAQIFEGLTRADAAARVMITDNALYQALRKPAVLRYWNECLDVLRTGQRARNIQRLTEIRDQKDNLTAAVQAIKMLEPPREDAGRPVQVSVTAGVVIRAPDQARSSLEAPNTLELKANTVTDMVRSDLANDPSVLLFDDGGSSDGA